MDDRVWLNGILVVVTTGIGWQQLPQQVGDGSGMTWWRRLGGWQTPGCGSELETRGVGDVLAVACHHLVLAGGRYRPAPWSAGSGAGLGVVSAGRGANGHRL
jgi:hypothetical protein